MLLTYWRHAVRGLHGTDWLVAGLIGGVTGAAKLLLEQGSLVPEAWIKQIGDAGPWAIFAFLLAAYALWERRTALEKLVAAQIDLANVVASSGHATQSAITTALDGVRADLKQQSDRQTEILERALNLRNG